ncbi:cation:proton antiporter, partial [Arthrobacter sp. Cr_A7]|nr:cation:proton antiporter [Arthrobacter sp. Cr_A7]
AQELAGMATAYVLIMAVVGPLAARYVEPLVRAMLPQESLVTKA